MCNTHSGAGENLVESILTKYPTWHHLWAAYKALGARPGAAFGAAAAGPARGACDALLSGLPVLEAGGNRAEGGGRWRKVGPWEEGRLLLPGS